MSKVKNNGVVYTPEYIVEIILNQSNYKGINVIKKHVIDNSCGDGAFLKQIVKRYIESFINEKNINSDENKLELKKDLETYIHGIELDESEMMKAIDSLNEIVSLYGLEGINWDINQGNTLEIDKYNGKMDFVLGNPPYVRVHNLGDDFHYIKEQKFTTGGMTDLFIIFYEIGLEMLNETGVLGYITPSSIFNSLAGFQFRNYTINNKLLTSVIDLKHFQAFEGFMTYTAILTLDKSNRADSINYFDFDTEKLAPKHTSFLNYEDFFLENSWYFGKKESLDSLKNILKTDIKDKTIEIKNGFATLSDRLFINNDFGFDSKYIYPIIKASTGKSSTVFFPYDEDSIIVDFNLFEDDLKNYLLDNKDDFEKRSRDKNTLWYAFGRSQGIRDFFKDKITINALLRTKKDIKLNPAPAGTGVYSGLYLVGDFDYELINDILISDEFVEYISMLGKYKAGGYYTFSSSDLKKYVIYKSQ